MVRKVDEIKELFKRYGVVVLENSIDTVMINGGELIIGGVDDPDIVRYERGDMILTGMKQCITSFPLKDVSAYKILISHRPELIDMYKTLPVDLVLSGHSHEVRSEYHSCLMDCMRQIKAGFPSMQEDVYPRN